MCIYILHKNYIESRQINYMEFSSFCNENWRMWNEAKFSIYGTVFVHLQDIGKRTHTFDLMMFHWNMDYSSFPYVNTQRSVIWSFINFNVKNQGWKRGHEQSD